MGNSMTKSELLAELYGRGGCDHRYDEPDPR